MPSCFPESWHEESTRAEVGSSTREVYRACRVISAAGDGNSGLLIGAVGVEVSGLPFGGRLEGTLARLELRAVSSSCRFVTDILVLRLGLSDDWERRVDLRVG